MLVYWLLFLYFAVGALREQPRLPGSGRADLLFRCGGFILVLLIGFRFRVGSDWFHYLDMYREARFKHFPDILLESDPAFQFLNWLVQQIGGDFWVVNLAGAAIFTWGLMRFAEAQPRPWLTVLVAVPYLVVVVAMGYVRQGIAIGIILAGITSYLNKGSALRLAIYVAFAAAFHRSAVVALPLVALGNERGRWINIIIVAASSYLMYKLFVSSGVDKLDENYLQASAESQGATIRVAMCVLPAILFTLRGKAVNLSKPEWIVWRNFSIAAFLSLAGLALSPSTTVVDRLALYVIPLQLAILSRPRVTFLSEQFGVLAVIFYSALVQFTWMQFATHARDWLPYRFFPIW